MPGTNDFEQFCPTDTGTNLETLVAYGTDPDRISGNKPGVASSKLNNRALRQASAIAAALAQVMANVTGDNVLDDATQINLVTTMEKLFIKSPTITKLTAAGAGTYTPPAGCQWLRVRLVGAASGGSGTAADGVTGGDTTFGTGATQVKGGGGTATAGGTATLGTGNVGTAVPGGVGDYAPNATASGGRGAPTPFGGGGPGAASAGIAAIAPAANTGSGGGGSTSNAAGTGRGGCSGGFVDAIMPGPFGGSFAYVVGAGGGAGFTALNASAGSDGYIEIEEHYN